MLERLFDERPEQSRPEKVVLFERPLVSRVEEEAGLRLCAMGLSARRTMC
jgi:hypothetical protein